jgi:starch-binding outer membrane protein, SusD/RagB family
MKFNKKLFWGLLVMIPLAATIAGCKKFLDRKPLTATLQDLHQGTLEAQSFGLYSVLRSYAGFSTLPWLDFNSIRDDDAQKGSSTTDGQEINAEFETFQYTKDDWATDTYWNGHYYMINQANKELFTADSLKVSDPASLRNVGEACFFRAYSYFELVKAYGDIPLINYYFTNAAQGIRPKSPATAIYALIDSDLNVATQRLPLNWVVAGTNQYPGRLTSGTAKALWAQTYLFRQNWARVAGLCNDIIASSQYSLTPNFPDIWKDGLNGAGKNGPESIFEMQATIGQNGTPYYGVSWGTSQNVRQGGATNDWNLGWGWNTPTDKLASDWDNSDPRKAATILFSGQYDGGSATGGYGATLPAYNPGSALDQKYWNKKVYSDPQMRAFTGEIGPSGGADWLNHRIIRYADVLLMLAEAANETGDGATAEANLEKVRARARGTAAVLPHIAFASQSQMRTAIKNERRWEFAMEGLRFYDLVRWGDAISVLGPLGYTNRCRFYPIPQPAINITNGVLVQNPEW